MICRGRFRGHFSTFSYNQLKIRRREPIELDIPPEEPRLIKKWIAEYRSKMKIGVVEMAALLCLNVDEFLELYS